MSPATRRPALPGGCVFSSWWTAIIKQPTLVLGAKEVVIARGAAGGPPACCSCFCFSFESSPKPLICFLHKQQTDESCRSFGVWELLSSLASFSTPLLDKRSRWKLQGKLTNCKLPAMAMANRKCKWPPIDNSNFAEFKFHEGCKISVQA